MPNNLPRLLCCCYQWCQEYQDKKKEKQRSYQSTESQPTQYGYPPQRGYLIQQGYPPHQYYHSQGQTAYHQQGYQTQPYMYGASQPGANIVPPAPPVMQLPRSANGSKYPVDITCPSCDNNGKSRLRFEIGYYTLIASCLCCVCVFPLCGILPCLLDDCKDRVHLCSYCGYKVGTKKKELC